MYCTILRLLAHRATGLTMIDDSTETWYDRQSAASSAVAAGRQTSSSGAMKSWFPHLCNICGIVVWFRQVVHKDNMAQQQCNFDHQ